MLRSRTGSGVLFVSRKMRLEQTSLCMRGKNAISTGRAELIRTSERVHSFTLAY